MLDSSLVDDDTVEASGEEHAGAVATARKASEVTYTDFADNDVWGISSVLRTTCHGGYPAHITGNVRTLHECGWLASDHLSNLGGHGRDLCEASTRRLAVVIVENSELRDAGTSDAMNANQ